MIKILKYDELERNALQSPDSKAIADSVAGIISDVIMRGDEALREYTEKFDKCLLREF